MIPLSTGFRPVLPPLSGYIVAWAPGKPYTDCPGGETGIVDLALTELATFALTTSGEVLAWHESNQSDPIIANKPAVLSADAVAIASYGYTAAAITADGEVKVWGNCSYDKCVVPDEAKSGVTGIAVGASNIMALKDGAALCWGSTGWDRTTVPLAAQSDVIKVVASAYTCFALKSDGTIVAWGSNSSSMDTVPAEAHGDIADFKCGAFHALVLKKDGTTLRWGATDNNLSVIPVEAQTGVASIGVGVYHNSAIKEDGTYIQWGSTGVPMGLPDGTPAPFLTCGGRWHHAVLVKD